MQFPAIRSGARHAAGSTGAWRRAACLGLALTFSGAAGTTRAASEAEKVVREACGPDPAVACVAELRKVCHRKMTMRCYLSRKQRFDLKRADSRPYPEEPDPFGDPPSFGE